MNEKHPRPSSGRAREPVQVYLEPPDRALLETVAARTSLPRSEVLRLALRRMAAELPGAERPGAALSVLVGALDAARGVPRDLAARHDEYLYATGAPAARRVREQPPKKKRNSSRTPAVKSPGKSPRKGTRGRAR